jgi:hypothetical protein
MFCNSYDPSIRVHCYSILLGKAGLHVKKINLIFI